LIKNIDHANVKISLVQKYIGLLLFPYSLQDREIPIFNIYLITEEDSGAFFT